MVLGLSSLELSCVVAVIIVVIIVIYWLYKDKEMMTDLQGVGTPAGTSKFMGGGAINLGKQVLESGLATSEQGMVTAAVHSQERGVRGNMMSTSTDRPFIGGLDYQAPSPYIQSQHQRDRAMAGTLGGILAETYA